MKIPQELFTKFEINYIYIGNLDNHFGTHQAKVLTKILQENQIEYREPMNLVDNFVNIPSVTTNVIREENSNQKETNNTYLSYFHIG